MIFSAFLIQDVFWVLVHFPDLGGPEQVIHHLIFLVCSVIGGIYEIHILPFSWLIMGEFSTILLEARWFLIHTVIGVGAEVARRVGARARVSEPAIVNVYSISFSLTPR